MPPTEAPQRGLGLSIALTLLALVATGLALALWGLRAPDDAAPVLAPPPPQAEQAASAAASGAPPIQPATAMTGRPASSPASSHNSAAEAQDLAAHVPPGQAPAMAEVIQRLNQAGVHSGLGAFNPPGTRPPLIGLAVPEDFELPPGFVRHHQATDDGQRIEAVLMFAPDHPYVLAHPDLSSRVVPASLAPEGLPLRTITLPTPRSRKP